MTNQTNVLTLALFANFINPLPAAPGQVVCKELVMTRALSPGQRCIRRWGYQDGY